MPSQSSQSFRPRFHGDDVDSRPQTHRQQAPTALSSPKSRTTKAKKRANRKKRQREAMKDSGHGGQAAQGDCSSSSQRLAAEGSAASKTALKDKSMAGDRQAEQGPPSNSSGNGDVASGKDIMSKDDAGSKDTPREQGGKEEGSNENGTGDKGYGDGTPEFVPLTEFKRFPKMPLELRRMVWDLVLPDPQVITITGNGYFRRVVCGTYTTQTFVHRPSAFYKIPAMLSICKESREEVMVLHRPSFRAQFGGIPIFFNAQTDILHFACPDALVHFYAGSLPNYVEHHLTRGYRWNMEDAHELVRQVAVSRVADMEGVLGGVFNQMRGLENVLLEDKYMRVDSEDLIRDYTMGWLELELGWEEYTLERSPDKPVGFKILNSADFNAFIGDWKGSIMQPEDFRNDEDEDLDGDPILNTPSSTP